MPAVRCAAAVNKRFRPAPTNEVKRKEGLCNMIFYFSGTGNSQWAAEQIACLTEDKAYDISKQKQRPDLHEEKQIGLVFPVYAWGVPEPMLHFAASLEKTDAFTFGVCTCGSEAGLAMKKLSRLYPLNSSYSLVMPNNYIIGADVDDEQTVQRKISAARQEIQALSGEVLQRKNVYRVNEGSFAGLKSGFVNFGFNRFARSTKAFYASDACNGCGLCAKNCPAATISLVDGKPAWGKQCYQCLRCINECPQRAIQYGKGTISKGRYSIRDQQSDC